MISLPSGTRIWLVAGVTDMRKSFNGLGEQVQHVLNDNPFSGHLFIFRGRRGDTVKILWADADGLCLFTKRLEEGQFIWPAVRDGKVSITRSQLAMNRPGFPGECFICELRLPDHRFRWKHNKLFLLLPEEYGPAFPAIVDCYTSPPT